MELLPIIILASGGLAICIFYLLYQLFLFKKSKKKTLTDSSKQKEEEYVYCDEYEEGDSLIINFKKH